MEDRELPLGEHLEELRQRIIHSLYAIVGIGILAYVFRESVLGFLMRPYREESMIYIHPTEAFLTYLKLAGLTGLILSTPWVLYQIWKFVIPALYENEERYFRMGFIIGGGLFYVGVAAALLIGLPLSLDFLSGIGGESLDIQLSVRNYISFVSLLSFAVGLVFELPLLILILVKLNFTTPDELRRNRRFAILIAFVVAAFLTPTDAFSQAFMAIPLVLLFEFSVLFVRLVVPRQESEESS